MPFHTFTQDRLGWETHADEIAFANPYLEVHAVQVTSPSRAEPFSWTVVHRKAAVVVVPRTAEGQYVLVRQERVPIRSTIWEFPAGQIDQATDQDAAAICATGLRELGEESGYTAAPQAEVISLGHFFPSCGFTDEHSHLLLIHPVVPSGKGMALDASESISEARTFTADELRAMIASGEICDANTLSAFARLAAKGLV